MSPRRDTTEDLALACALFERCVDLDPAGREALLAAENPCATVAGRVRDMLAADARAGDPFGTPAADWAARLAGEPDTLDGLLGQSIGGFRILSRLGEGGSSVVFAAERDVAGGIQPVALKLLRSGLFSASAQRRFRREQAILAQLSHPNVARLIDAGVSTAGIPYIAMERIDGRPLLEAARERGLGLADRLRLVAEVALAVDAAHRALVVHRDLKPANVLVDREGHVKVLDFGIAKLLDDDGDEPTRTLQIALTPGYAAPEQYRPGALTTAVDVYALGVIAAELVLDARLGPDARLPRGPGADAARARWQALDADLATLLRTALAEEPARRYASARHLADDVARYLAHEPIAAHPPSRAYRARKFVARHRVGLGVGAAMFATLLGALGLVSSQRDLARQQAARADSLRDFMFAAFAEAEPGAAREGPATVVDAVRHAITASDADPAADVGARLELRLRLAQVLQRQGDLEGARGLFEEVRASAQGRGGTSDPLVVEAAHLLVQNSMARGEFALARTQLDALPREADPARRVERLSLSAVLASRVRDLERALRDGADAMALAREVGDAELIRTTLNDWGVVLLAADRVDDAIAAYEELLAANRARFGERHQRVANVLAALARAWRRQGDLDRAEAAARAAVEIDRAVYPSDDRHAAVNLNALMMVLRERGDLDGALDVAREALRINVAALGEANTETALSRYGVGDLLALRGDFAEAVPLLEDSVTVNTREFGARHWRTAAARMQYGYALGMRGPAAAGAAQLEQAIADLRALPDGDLARLCSALDRRVQLAAHAGDIAGARQWLDALQAADPEATPGKACWPGQVALRRAALAIDSGASAEAADALAQAQSWFAQPSAPPALVAEHALLEAQWRQQSGHPEAAVAATQALARFDALPFPPPALRQRAGRVRAGLAATAAAGPARP